MNVSGLKLAQLQKYAISSYFPNGTKKKDLADNLQSFSREGDIITATLSKDLFDILHFGENSTTVQLQDADTENLDDTFVSAAAPTNNFGTLDDFRQSMSLGVSRRESPIKFNTSSIPAGAEIEDSQLCLVLDVNDLDSGAEGFDVGTHHLYTSYSWTETTPTWNTKPSSGTDYNATSSDTVSFTGDSSIDTLYCWNVTTILQAESSDNNVSIYLIPENVVGSPVDADEVEFDSKESSVSSERPYLNITYSISDSCTYTSGDWVVTDQCDITSGTINVCPNIINISSTGQLNVSGSTIINASRIIWYPSDAEESFRLRWISPSRVIYGGC